MSRGLTILRAMMPLLLISGLLIPVAHAEPTGGARGVQWTATHDGPQKYPNIFIDWDIPITMSDGTVLKANLYRPATPAGPVTEPMPVVVNMIPYTKLQSMIATTGLSIPVFSDAVIKFFRDFDMTGTPLDGITDLTRMLGGGMTRSFAADPQLIKSGYAQLVVDVRGTGFSQGIFELFGDRERRDTFETIEWTKRQPWSNGKTGMNGVSYSAINQLYLAEEYPNAVDAIVPIEPGSDLTRDLIAPGGAAGIGFIGPLIVFAINAPKWIPDLQSIIQGRFDWKWLADRLASPMTFVMEGLQALFTASVDQLTPHLRELADPNRKLRQGWTGHPEKVQVPTMIVGTWHDIFASSEPVIYNAIKQPPGRKQLVMGDGYHVTGGFDMRGPEKNEPPRIDVLQRAWLDRWLKGIDNGIDKYGPVTLWQQGGGWTTTNQFPRAGVAHHRMYLSAAPSGTAPYARADGSLSFGPGAPGRMTVAPGLASICSRDSVQITAGVTGAIPGCGEDARFHEREGLTFTSAPVGTPTQISGPIAVRLNTVHDALDGYWVVTVNDVAPDGRSTVITTGQLAASVRQIDDARSKRSANGDYTDPFPFLELERRQQTVPGQPTQLDIRLIPTDAVLQPGHRLRVDVFASNFPKGLPLGPILFDTALRPQHLQLDPNAPSFVNIPLSRTW